MFGLELACLAILALYLAVELPRRRARGVFLRRLGLVTAASWLAEDTCIRLYDFYAYAPGWSVFVDRVPLLVILIWAPVVFSAWALARRLLPAGGRWVPLAGAALVFADAWLIEPIAVAAGLWRWHAPGLFGVPPIGVLGWAFFAGTCIALFEWNDRRGAPARADALVVPLAALATHALLLATWWGALRWISVPLPGRPAALVAGAAAVALTALALRTGARARVPFALMATRIPPAALFFVLLALHGRDTPALVAWALAFAPPYLALTPWEALRRATASWSAVHRPRRSRSSRSWKASKS